MYRVVTGECVEFLHGQKPMIKLDPTEQGNAYVLIIHAAADDWPDFW